MSKANPPQIGNEIESWTLEGTGKTVFDNPQADGEWLRADSDIVVSQADAV